MSIFTLTVNGQEKRVDTSAEMPLLWVLRDQLRLKGAKFGCGLGICGACTVHLDGTATPSCMIKMADVGSSPVVTIEALGDGQLHPIQKAWIDLDVPQCGYCQTGMMMAAAALLATNPDPTREELNSAIPNICRCGTYPRIIAAIERLSGARR